MQSSLYEEETYGMARGRISCGENPTEDVLAIGSIWLRTLF